MVIENAPRKPGSFVGNGRVKRGRPRKAECGPDGKRRPEIVAKILEKAQQIITRRGPGNYVRPVSDRPVDPDAQTGHNQGIIEQAMRRGFTDPYAVAKLTGLSVKSVQYHIKQIHARWEVIGGGRDVARYRGTMISYYETILQECWTRLQNSGTEIRDDMGNIQLVGGDPRNETALLSTITQATVNLAAMYGVSPKVVEKMMLASTDRAGIGDRVARQDKAIGFLRELNEILKEAKKSETQIDLDAEEIKEE